jgi:hypothetical protein
MEDRKRGATSSARPPASSRRTANDARAAALRHRRLGRRRQVTLIGRLLYDSKQILEDQLEHVAETSERRGDGYVDLALLTDGLRAEREQGITIDVAYRYFQTRRARRFIIADCPATSSTRATWSPAPRPPTSRSCCSTRARACSSRPAPRLHQRAAADPALVVAVNKMDLVDYSRSASTEIVDEFDRLGRALGDQSTSRSSRSRRCTATTSSTARAHAVVRRADAALPPRAGRGRLRPPHDLPTSLPVQWVIRPAASPTSTTTTAATPASWPAARCARRRGGRAARRPAHADRRDRHLRRRARGGVPADVGDAALEDELDVSRGELICHADEPPTVARELEATSAGWRASRCARAGATRSSTPRARDRDRRRDRVPRRRQHARARRAPERARPQRHRPRALRTSAPLLVDPYSEQPPHRQLHPDRRGDQRHRRRRDDR